jgi:hypothetical protein
MNTGGYDHLLASYLKAPVTLRLSSLGEPKATGDDWDGPGAAVITDAGLRLVCDSLCHAGRIDLSVDNNDLYHLVFLRGGDTCGRVDIAALRVPGGGLRVDTLVVPDDVRPRGFDGVLIVPEGGDGYFSVGHFIPLP